jgi:uncharacterized membrane protein (GlpM family)
MTVVFAKSAAAAGVVFLILLAQRHDDSALAAAIATIPIGTIIGLVAFAGADPSGAHAFTRSAVLALPLWGAFTISTFLLTRVLDWRLAVAAGLLVWAAAALVYLHLTRGA